MTTSLIITGAGGRMGRELITQALGTKGFQLVGATENPKSESVGEDAGLLVRGKDAGVVIESSLEKVFQSKNFRAVDGDPVIIDFTGVEVTLKHVRTAMVQNIPMVIGTTGFNAQQKKQIEKAAANIPMVLAPNMSVGVNTMLKLVADAAKVLGDGYDIEILEAHHRLKKDAPSGTAVRLAEVLAEATDRNYPQNINFHREGIIGERDSKEIGMQVIRGGDIVGEHTVFYCGTGERIEIKHVATSRKTFADGALRAAAWLKGKEPGLYDMRDVLGLK